ncbi:MAG: hypothetical protein AB1593_06490 [Pseudomonadota bacterium]
MRTALRIVSYMLALIVGGAIGLYFGFRLGQDSIAVFDMAETAYYAAFMETQMSDGTDAAREEAIHTFLALNEKRMKQPSKLFLESPLAKDSALAYARLAALAKKRGATQEAERYPNHAASFCTQTGWQECSPEKIMSMVQRLDRTGIFVLKDTK